MTRPTNPFVRRDAMDPLLDAFADDFPSAKALEALLATATPEQLEEADAAADAILARLSLADRPVAEPAPRSWRPPNWATGLVGLAAAAAVAFYVIPAQVGPVDGEIPAEVAGSQQVIVPLVMPLADGPGLLMKPETVISKEIATAADGSETRVAVLTSGGLSFERHNGIVPEIDDVRWARLPLVAHPVGTVFDARAIGGMALVVVREGKVELHATDGTALATVPAGRTVVVRSTGGALDYKDVTTGWDLDRIRALGPEGPALSEAIFNLRSDALTAKTKADVLKMAKGVR